MRVSTTQKDQPMYAIADAERQHHIDTIHQLRAEIDIRKTPTEQTARNYATTITQLRQESSALRRKKPSRTKRATHRHPEQEAPPTEQPLHPTTVSSDQE